MEKMIEDYLKSELDMYGDDYIVTITFDVGAVTVVYKEMYTQKPITHIMNLIDIMAWVYSQIPVVVPRH